ncbi:MAG: GntR family transcriptional regulator [Planktomarina sp.]
MTQATLTKVDQAPQTLRDIVQDRMRTAILEGHFAPGERLVERPLCEQLGVSRTVIREAIRFLEAEGLVDIISNRGPIVATLNWHQAQQIYDIRRQLEGSAVAACAAKPDADFNHDLTQALHGIKATLNDNTWSDLLHATTHFYAVIFNHADHSIAWDIVQRLNGRISRLRALTIADKTRPRTGFSHMSAIHAATIGHDPSAARTAVEAHIDDASATAQKFLKVQDEQ